MPATTITTNGSQLRTRQRLRRRPRARQDTADAIDVLVVDDDPAVRSSLQGVLGTERGIGKVDTAPSSGIAIKRTIARRPRVCLINYHLGRDAGLLLTRHLKRLERSPYVVVYGAAPYVITYGAALDITVAAAARIAGADGVIVSPPSRQELGQIIRRVAGGEKQLPTITPSGLRDLTARLEVGDRPIATMLVRDTSPREVAAVLGLSREQLSTRQWAILDRLRRPIADPSGEHASGRAPRRADGAIPRFARPAAASVGHHLTG